MCGTSFLAAANLGQDTHYLSPSALGFLLGAIPDRLNVWKSNFEGPVEVVEAQQFSPDFKRAFYVRMFKQASRTSAQNVGK